MCVALLDQPSTLRILCENSAPALSAVRRRSTFGEMMRESYHPPFLLLQEVLAWSQPIAFRLADM